MIGGFDKLTLLNFPNRVACTIFTRGCNFKCPFCHNSSLINKEEELIDEETIFKYLEKRIKILDGVCITGGEPLIHKNIKELIKRIKDMGFEVKLDTNGSNPELLKELIDEKLIDYVAMDIKNIFDKYDITSGTKVNIDNIKKSINIIEKSNIEYEFRTTIIKEYHSIEDIIEISKMINKKSNYYIQNFVYSDGVVNKDLHGFSSVELESIKNKINNKNIIFRDL